MRPGQRRARNIAANKAKMKAARKPLPKIATYGIKIRMWSDQRVREVVVVGPDDTFAHLAEIISVQPINP